MKKLLQRIMAGVLTLSTLLTILPLNAFLFAEESTLYGDVNRSGIVDQNDAVDLKKYLTEYSVEIDTVAADVNSDGKIDLRDLLLIEKYVAGYDIVLGDNVKITFVTNGGRAVSPIMLCNGAVMTDYMDVPVTEKPGYIFTGWVKADGTPFYADEPITEKNLVVYANFEVLESDINETPQSYALEDQPTDISFDIITSDDSSANDVMANITLLPKDGSDPVDLHVNMVNSKLFTISAVNGFNPGCTYELSLNDGVYFKDKDESIRKATFIIHKDEVNQLEYNDDIKYIKDTVEMSYTIDGSAITVPVLNVAVISDDGIVSGWFNYSKGGLNIGDTLCIYENTDPRERDYIANDYEDDSVAYIKVTNIQGTKIFFRSIDETQVSDVIFIPDTIPFSVEKLPQGNNSSIDIRTFDSVAWSFMGRSGTPDYDIGDYVVLYSGNFADMTEDSPVYLGVITAINGDIISFEKTTADAIADVNEVFLSKPLDGDELLGDIDVESVENRIEKQAMDSGFAKDAVDYLLTMASGTDNFRNMSLENMSITDTKGNALTQEQTQLLTAAAKPKIFVSAEISKKPTNFNKGVRLKLDIDAEFTIELDDGDMKFLLHATFVEEIYVKVSLNSHAHVTWYIFIPVLDELTFSSSTDIKNYTSISIDLRTYTVSEDKSSVWGQFQIFYDKYKNTLNQIKELERKIDEANEPQEKLDAYKDTIRNLWLTLPADSEDLYNNYREELGEVNMSSVLNELLNSTTDEKTQEGVQDLMDRYSKMMKHETSWITLVEQEIFDAGYNFLGGLVSVNFTLNFVVKTNVNISMGINMDYLVGKRYSTWINIMNGTSGSYVTDLTDEEFAFKFYVMGHIGLKMGVQATVSLEVLWGLAGMGLTGEFGPYIKLWGYFIYQYHKIRTINNDNWDIDTRKDGALYLEFGIYVAVSFNVDLIKKTIYNPDIYDKEFPILTAGDRKNVYAYGYEMDKDEVVVVKDDDNNSNTGINMPLPDGYALMQYIDLVEGNIEKEIRDFSDFYVTLSNPNFKFDSKTGNISVNVPKDIRYMKCDLTLTWKQGKLSFSTKDLKVVIPLVWTNLADSELKEKFTVTVNVGNETDGYIPVWSERVVKNDYFNLPTHEEILSLINYDNYNFNGTNLKYSEVVGYGSQQTTDLLTYSNANFFFYVTPREYEISIKDVQNANGSTSTGKFKAKFGERFDISSLKNSGFDDEAKGLFTAYYTTVAKDQSGNIIQSDIGRTIDITFAKELLSGTTYSATYVDNFVTATFKFDGDVSYLGEKTIKIKRGTTPPDVFTQDVLAQKALVTNITPKLGDIYSDTVFTVVGKLKPIIMHTINYETNGGDYIAPVQVPEESVITLPNPTRRGYTFKGWYSDATLDNLFDLDIMPTYDITVYAKWEANSYQITFDPNMGALPAGTQNPITVTYDTTYGTLPKPVRDQYRFEGWFTERSGGSLIRQDDVVSITANVTLYARWKEKSTIDPNTVLCPTGQITTYNTEFQPVTFNVTNGLDKSSFKVWYKRQGLDNEWGTEAVNAGKYDIKITRAEDENYKYFEKTFTLPYTIDKAPSSFIGNYRPYITSVYCANIKIIEPVIGQDYIGGETIEYAVSNYNTAPPANGWVDSSIIHNIYDSAVVDNKREYYHAADVYTWVRIPESENYYGTEPRVSSSPYSTLRVGSLFSDIMGSKALYYELNIRTGNDGTSTPIYYKFGANGEYQKVSTSMVKNEGKTVSIKMDYYTMYRDCGASVPITIKYEGSSKNDSWVLESLKMIIHDLSNTYMVYSDTYTVNQTFSGKNDIERTYVLTGLKRQPGFSGTVEQSPMGSTYDVQTQTNDFSWDWSIPEVFDYTRGVTYNPFYFINAPVLVVSFDNPKYNKYIKRDFKSFTLSRRELKEAMAADGVNRLTLTYYFEYKPLNGEMTVYPNSAVYGPYTLTVVNSGVKATSSSSNTMQTKLVPSMLGAKTTLTSGVTSINNDTFDVSVNIDKNPGIWGTKFALDYDKTKVELTGYTLGNVFSSSEVVDPERYDNGRYVFLAAKSNDFTDTTDSGKIVTLHFKVKDGVTLTDYPVYLDTDVSQAINSEGILVTEPVDMNAPKISVQGNTGTYISGDNVTVSANAGSYAIKSIEVKKDFGDFVDITSSYNQGYRVTENGTYTFKLTTQNGEEATTSITYTKIDNVKPVLAIDSGAYEEGTWQKGNATLTLSNTADTMGKTTFYYRIGTSGTWKEAASPFSISAEGSEFNRDYYLKAVSESGVESDIVKFTVKLDNKAPGGKITVNKNIWTTLLNNITFGYFYKNNKTITITSSDDGSSVAKTEYYLASGKISDFNDIVWKTYNEPISVNTNSKYVVYARVTDYVGNMTIISSDGLVFYTDSEAVTTYLSFTKTVTGDLNATVKLNGNSIKQIKVGSKTLVEGTDFSVTGDIITLKAAYLNTLSTGIYSVIVSYYPLGVSGTQIDGDTPATTSFSLNVARAIPVLSINADPLGPQTRPNSVILSANINEGATGLLLFKANGKNIGIPVPVGQTVTFTASGSVNDYTFTVEYSGDINYTNVTSDGLSYSFVKGEQTPLSFVANTPTEVTYGDKLTLNVAGGSGTGKITYSVISGSATIDGNTVTFNKDLGDVVIKATKAADDDYNEASAEHTITVNKKPVTISGITSENKVYDGTADAALSGTAVIDGKVNGDDVNVVLGTAAFADKVAGNGKTVTFEGFALTGEDAGKYELIAQPESVTAYITPKVIDMNVTIAPKSYDGLNTAVITEVSLNDVVAGDDVKLADIYPKAVFTSIATGESIPVGFDGNFTLIGDDAVNYTLTQPTATGNIINNYTTVKGTDYTVTSNDWSITDFVVSAKDGYELSLTNTADGEWSETLIMSDETSDGCLTFYVRNKSTGEISLAATEGYKIDRTPPEGDITIGESTIKKLLNTITFGLFFKETKTITVTSSDDRSGVASVVYKLSSEVLTEREVYDITDWTEYTGTITLSPNSKTVVYVKITDIAGNVVYIGSDGLVLYTDSEAETTEVSFTKTSTDDVFALVTLNDNIIKDISVNGSVLNKDTDYTVTGETITLKASYLDTLAAGEYTAEVSYYPLGETGAPHEGSDLPITTSFTINVVKAVPTLSINADPLNSQTRPNSVILSANITEGATGILQFKANGENIGEAVAVGQAVTFTASGSVNDYTFTVEYSGDDNYSAKTSDELTYSFVKGEQSSLIFDEETPTEKTYGDEPFDVTVHGGSGAGEITYSVVSGNATIVGNRITLTGAGDVIIKATKAADDDYNETSVEHTITVNKKPVTITGITSESKVYDGTPAAAISGTAVINGKVNGDDVNVFLGTAAFADKVAGNGKTVTFEGFALTGEDAGKYELIAQPESVTADITPKVIDMNVTVAPKAYDGLNSAVITEASLNDVVSGDDVNLSETYPKAVFTSVSAGEEIPVEFEGNFELVGEDASNYILTQPSSITADITNTYNPEKGADYTVSSNDWSNTDFVVSAKDGYELSLTNTADGDWRDTLTMSDETSDGSLRFYVRNKTTGAISLSVSEGYKIDRTAPDGDITIGESSIKKLLNTITFGLFFKETKTITVTSADDRSGVALVEYKLSTEVLTESEVYGITDWTEYTKAITLNPNSKTVVYVKITDNAGNVICIGSDGLVLDNTAPVISGIENEKVYCAPVKVKVTDVNLDTVTLDGKEIALTDGSFTVNPADKAQTITATDKAGNNITVTVMVYEGHAWNEGIITEPATADKEGIMTYTCDHCGEIKTEVIEKLPPAIIEGISVQWKPGDSGLTFRSNAAFSDFVGVLVDGKLIDSDNYDVKEGSIIVTLKPQYLATLSAGIHTISIKSTGGSATAEFTILPKADDTTIVNPDDKKSPQTGDKNNIPLFVTLLFIPSTALTLLTLKSKKRKKEEPTNQ